MLTRSTSARSDALLNGRLYDGLTAHPHEVVVEHGRTGGPQDLAKLGLCPDGAEDPGARAETDCERALLQAMGGGCQVPIGAHATIESRTEGPTIHLRAIVASPDGERVIHGQLSGSDASMLGRLLGEQLLKDGAREILSSAYSA